MFSFRITRSQNPALVRQSPETRLREYTPRFEASSETAGNSFDSLAERQMNNLLAMAFKDSPEFVTHKNFSSLIPKAQFSGEAAARHDGVRTSAKRAEQALAELNRLPVWIFWRKNMTRSALRALRAAVNAQYRLARAIKRFEQATEMTAETAELWRDCQIRAFELVRFACLARERDGNPFAARHLPADSPAGETAGEAGRRVVTTQALLQECAETFSFLSRLESRKEVLSPEELLEAVREIVRNFSREKKALQRRPGGASGKPGTPGSGQESETFSSGQESGSSGSGQEPGTSESGQDAGDHAPDRNPEQAAAGSGDAEPEETPESSGSPEQGGGASSGEEQEAHTDGAMPESLSPAAGRGAPAGREAERDSPRLTDSASAAELDTALAAAATRVEHLLEARLRRWMLAALEDLLPGIPDGLLHFAENEIPVHGKKVAGLLKFAEETKEQIAVKIRAVNRDKEEIAALVGSVLSAVTEHERIGIYLTLKIASWFKERSVTRNKIRKTIKKVYPGGKEARRLESRIKKILKNKEIQAQYAFFAATIKKSLFFSERAQQGTGLQIFLTMLCPGIPEHRRGSFLRRALELDVGIGAAVEAALHDIAPELLELAADTPAPVSGRTLGAGSLNGVELCLFKDSHDRERELIFKPVRSALPEVTGGYQEGDTPAAREMKLNIAAGRIARAIGCGQVIAWSAAGFHNGQPGLFMEHVRGLSMGHVLEGEIIGHARGKDLNLIGMARYLQWKGSLKTMLASMLEQFYRLEWADALSGQTGRHRGNYIFIPDPGTGKVRLKGLDNDRCCNVRVVGPGLIDIRPPRSKKIEELAVFVAEIGIPVVNDILNLTVLPDEALIRARSTFGLGHCAPPNFIDRHIFALLMELSPGRYTEMLRPLLTEEALESAVKRLRNARDHAKDLELKNRVIDDWRGSEVFEAECRLQVLNLSSPAALVRNSLFIGNTPEELQDMFAQCCRETE